MYINSRANYNKDPSIHFTSADVLVKSFFLYRREDFIALAILRLVEEEKAVVEGAGVTAFAAVLAGMLPELQDKK